MTDGFDIVITLERDAPLPAVPLPATLPLVLVGLGAFGAVRLRSRAS